MFNIVDRMSGRRENAAPREVTLSREKLKALEELQRVDLKIRDLAAEAEKHPTRLKQIEAERNQAKAALDAARGRLADNERARRQQQDLLGLEKDKVRKWESRLNELKTPREYAALARELDIAKKTNQTAAEEIIRLNVEYEELKKATAAAELVLAEKEGVVAREGTEIEALLSDVQTRVTELERERVGLVEKCDKSLINKYERIRKQRGGIAVAPVVAGTCKGCQRNIPPQMANNLLTGSEIMSCPNCHRFIYAADEQQTSEAIA
jgi:predicted  nucleic acid-binding Zn-ribbon protein